MSDKNKKVAKRVKFFCPEAGVRGWINGSKIQIIALESQTVQHNGHSDKVLGQSGAETLLDCTESGPIWANSTELLDANRPPATPESLNEDLSAESAKQCPDCHGTFEGKEGETCPTCGRFAVQKEALKPALPPLIPNQRIDVNASPNNEKEFFNYCWSFYGPGQIHGDFFGNKLTSEELMQAIKIRMADSKFEGDSIDREAVRDILFQLPHYSKKSASLQKVARVVHRTDGWHVLSEKGKNLGGPYKSKAEAVKRLRQVEYFKHNGAFRPFSKKVIAEVMVDPYQTLTDHITDMRGRMDQVQEKLQSVPAVKTAEDKAPEMDLPTLFADLTQGIDLLETKLGGDDIEPELHKGVEDLENKLWKLEEACGITPKLSEEEKAEPEHKEIVEDIEEKTEKEAVVTDETVEEITTNNPSLINTPSFDPNTPAPLGVQNVQPTDDDNLEVPVVAPTSPPAPGQKWVFDTQFNKYVAMPDPDAANKTI